MTMRLWFLGGILAGFAACAPVTEEQMSVEEPVVLKAPAVEAAAIARCPDDDDGIGGTGCSVD